jgi:hypothetical protein
VASEPVAACVGESTTVFAEVRSGAAGPGVLSGLGDLQGRPSDVDGEIAEPAGSRGDLEGRSLLDENRARGAEGVRLALDAHLAGAVDAEEKDVALLAGLLGRRHLGAPPEQRHVEILACCAPERTASGARAQVDDG